MNRLAITGLAASLAVLVACSDASEPNSSPATVGSVKPDPSPIPSDSLIQLIAPLDEPEYYCIDVPGAGAGVRLQAALQAHTCKQRQFEDEIFTVDQPTTGQIYMEAYGLCVQSDSAESGSPLYLKPCSDSPLQRFEYAGDRTIRLEIDGPRSLCIAVEPGEGQPTGGPSHLRRDLAVEMCASTERRLLEWSFPGLSPT